MAVVFTVTTVYPKNTIATVNSMVGGCFSAPATDRLIRITERMNGVSVMRFWGKASFHQ